MGEGVTPKAALRREAIQVTGEYTRVWSTMYFEKCIKKGQIKFSFFLFFFI